MCFFILLLAISPRLALVWLWLFTDHVDQAFDGFLVPFVGLLFLPVTTLMYALVWDPGGLTNGDWLFVFLGFAIDLMVTWGGRSHRQRAEA